MKDTIKELFNWFIRIFNKNVPERWYHDNGQLWRERQKLNKRYHGVQLGWYKNGKLGKKFHQINNIEHGMCEFWNNTGTRDQIKKYERGRTHAPKITFRYNHKYQPTYSNTIY